MRPAARLCIGFGEYDGICERDAGCAHTPLWCERCNELRMAHISAQFSRIERSFSGVAEPTTKETR